MRRGIARHFAFIVTLRDDGTVHQYDCADGDVTVRHGGTSFTKGDGHRREISLGSTGSSLLGRSHGSSVGEHRIPYVSDGAAGIVGWEL